MLKFVFKWDSSNHNDSFVSLINRLMLYERYKTKTIQIFGFKHIFVFIFNFYAYEKSEDHKFTEDHHSAVPNAGI